MADILPGTPTDEYDSLRKENHDLREELQREYSIKEQIRKLLETALLLASERPSGRRRTRTSSTAPSPPLRQTQGYVNVGHIPEKIPDPVSINNDVVDPNGDSQPRKTEDNFEPSLKSMEFIETEDSKDSDAGYFTTTDNVKYKNHKVEEKSDAGTHQKVEGKRNVGTEEVVDSIKGEPSVTFSWQGETHPLSGLIPGSGQDFWRRLQAGKSNRLLKGYTPSPKPRKRLSVTSLLSDKSRLLVKRKSESADSAETYWSLESPKSDSEFEIIKNSKYNRMFLDLPRGSTVKRTIVEHHNEVPEVVLKVPIDDEKSSPIEPVIVQASECI